MADTLSLGTIDYQYLILYACNVLVMSETCGDPPSVANTNVTTRNFTNGTIAIYSCTEGFQFYPEGGRARTVVCGEGGKWPRIRAGCVRCSDCGRLYD